MQNIRAGPVGGGVLIYYTETKVGRKSPYKKVVADETGKIISEREVEIPLYKIEKRRADIFPAVRRRYERLVSAVILSELQYD